jgi:hypothetical protein
MKITVLHEGAHFQLTFMKCYRKLRNTVNLYETTVLITECNLYEITVLITEIFIIRMVPS